MSRRRAPTAMRVPISRVRWLTAASVTAITPKPPARRATPAIVPKRAAWMAETSLKAKRSVAWFLTEYSSRPCRRNIRSWIAADVSSIREMSATITSTMLGRDVPAPGPDGHADADLAGTLAYCGQRDRHDPKAADKERDAGDGTENDAIASAASPLNAGPAQGSYSPPPNWYFASKNRMRLWTLTRLSSKGLRFRLNMNGKSRSRMLRPPTRNSSPLSIS